MLFTFRGASCARLLPPSLGQALFLLLLTTLTTLLLAHGSAGAWAGNSPLEVQFRSVAVPQNTVPSLAQDRAGFIWVATTQGLTRYDGYRLRPIERDGDTKAQRNLGWVRALSPSRDGRMWIGTEFLGLMAFDPAQDRVEAMSPPAPATGPALTIRSPIRALAEDAQGQVWVGTLGQGLLRYRPATRQFEAQDLRWQGEPEARVLALRVAQDGVVWVGHWRGLARQRPGGGWESVPLPEQPAGAPVLALAEDRAGRLWLGTQDGRLGVVEQGRLRWVQRLGSPVQALAVASDGRLWVGSKTGLLWVNPASGEIEAHLRHDPRRLSGLAGNDVSALLRDASGAMWVSGYGLGLQRHQHHPALAVRGPDSQASGPLTEPDVRALLRLRNGEVLAPTQRGPVVRLDGRPGRELASLGVWPRERGSVVESLAEAPDGSLWMASAGRLEHRSAQGRLLRDWPLDGGRAQRLLLRASGEVWLGMQEGLYRLPDATAPALLRVALVGGQALHGGVHALIEAPPAAGTAAAQPQLWVGGQQGLFREPAGGLPGRLEPVPQSPGESLASPIVMGLLQARDGSLWLDTPVAGLHRLRGWDAEGRARFDRIGERLGTEGVYGGNLHEDSRGRIWSQLAVYDPKTDRIDHFGLGEGAAFGSFWFFASTELPGGALLFGGSRGLLQVRPELFEPATGAPPLVISALRVNGQAYSPPPADPARPADASANPLAFKDPQRGLLQGLQLPAGTRTFSVEFAGLDYADPGRLRYQYRLQGLDSDWTSVDPGARSPSFGPLQPGRYALQMRVSAHPTLWGPTQLELPIELLPAWWQTVWARLGFGAAVLLAVWGFVRWRTRLLRQREAELQALVDERTAKLREASLTDALTGLRNRRYLELRLQDDLRLCLRRFEAGDASLLPGPDSDLVLMLLDLDHFKRINDVHGHAAGDAVLVTLAERLRRVFRTTDSLVRWGGEEVLVLVRETSREDAADLAARACAAVREQPFDIGFGQTVAVTVSIGFATFPLDPQRPRAWDWPATLGLADTALYAAKAQGRDGYLGAVEAQDLTPAEVPRDLSLWRDEPRLRLRASGMAQRPPSL
ncbi:ligand-binding sensor domain-containing diguanylate cyclase [Kinneretia aquatilis]|uniref:ligand-binding sensor domain-containing diguanylate cyclase n=1 Tax=Kinneretia aquatilis TaxID=2070761 RepID=UPI0014951C2C|nr:ligand-binding sensor domain-containing diguanylate cyclase [Paucibacter aquatile]WIV97542.1 diguanylate cyclase [Paucibacter aquatile]